MPALARLAAAVPALLPPLAALAQEAGGRDPARPAAGYSWLWIVVGAVVVAALFSLLAGRGRSRAPHPPARRP
jgi:hypothetical protein